MRDQRDSDATGCPANDRREFFRMLGAGALAAAGAVSASGPVLGQAKEPPSIAPVETNIQDFMKVPKGPHSIPGPFPGKVVQVTDVKVLSQDAIVEKVVGEMVEKGVVGLTGKDMKSSFNLFFKRDDVVGIKVNPVGPPLINTKHETVKAVIRWLTDNGIPPERVVVWDRFDEMLKGAGFTKEKYPSVGIEALQMIDESGDKWKDKDGLHLSRDRFDMDAFYFAKGVLGKGVQGYKDDNSYLNQHVFDGEYSYFGKLVTRRLTKIINISAFKNTGNGISMATKNLGYGAVCNTGRLHAPLFFRVCTEVLAAPWVRDKLVLNITDGIRGQYDGGPMLNAQFVYPYHSLFFGTDPFAMDMVCHRLLLEKRKSAGVPVNESPRFTEYLYQAQRLGLGVADPQKIQFSQVT